MGIGGAWGSREELLHPRGKDGRFITKGKMAVGIADALTKVLDAFSPRSFQSDQQAATYLQNKAHKGRLGGGSHSQTARFAADFDAVQEDLRDGVIDNPETKKYIAMMDQSMVELPEGLILTRQVTPEAFGMTAQQLEDPENGIYRLQGTLLADRGYSSTTAGTYMGSSGPGRIRMVYATPAGTKAMIPATSGTDREVVLDRDQTIRVSKIDPDGLGGYTVYAVAVPRDVAGPTPHPIGGHVGSSTSLKDRRASIEQSRQHFMKQAKAGVGDTPEPVPAEPAPMDESHILPTTPPVPGAPLPGQEHPDSGKPSPVQQTPSAPGAPPARTEPTVTESAGARTPRSAPAAAPQAATPPPVEAPSTPGVPAAPEAPAVHPNSVPGTPEEDFVPTGTTFRDAFLQSDIPSPSAGPDRAAANKAFLALRDGTRSPKEVLRDLDSDIETARSKAEHASDDHGRSQAGQNADRLQQLRDLISQHFKLEAAPAKKAAPRKAAAPKLDEDGNPIPRTPRKAAVPKLKEVEGEEDPNHNPTELDAISIDGSAGTNLRRIQNRVSAGDITDAKAEKELRDAAKYFRAQGKLANENGHATPEVREANKAKQDRIAEQYDTAADIMSGKRTARKATKKAAPAKAARPKADESGAPIMRGAALDKALKDAGLSTRGTADEKRARLAEGPKAEAPKAEAPAVARAVKAAPVKAAPAKVAPAKKAAPNIEDRPVNRTPAEQKRVDDAVVARAADLPAEPRNAEEKRIKDRAAAIRKERGEVPAAKAAAAPAADRTSVGAAAGKIRASDLQEGDRILVDPETGAATTRKTGAKAVTITSNQGASGRRRIIKAVDDDGNEVQVRGVGLRSGPDSHPVSIQTFLLEKAAPAKKRAAREAAEEEQIRGLRKIAEGGFRNKADEGPQAGRDEANAIQDALNKGHQDAIKFDAADAQAKAVGTPGATKLAQQYRRGLLTEDDFKELMAEESTKDLHPSLQTPEARQALKLDGNPRADAPFDSPERAREFADAWKSAGIKVEKGSAGTSVRETIEGIYLGNTSPAQGLKQMESDISFNRDDLGDVQRLLRNPPGDATPAELSALRKKEAKIKRDIATQEKVAKFLHGHFNEEKPAAAEVQAKAPANVQEFLENARPQDAKDFQEAVKEAGGPELKGNSVKEMFQDGIRQALAEGAKERAAKKAAKAAPAEIPAPAAGKPDHKDVAGDLDLPHGAQVLLQKELNGRATTRNSAKKLRAWAASPDGPGARAALMEASGAEKTPSWQAEHDNLLKQNADIEKLATRLESTTRAKLSAPAPAPKVLSPAEEKRAADVADIAGVSPAKVQARMVEAKESAAPAGLHHQATADILKTAGSREGAAAILKDRGKTAADLKGIAKAAGIPVGTRDRKQAIHDAIVDHFVPEVGEPSVPTKVKAKPLTAARQRKAESIASGLHEDWQKTQQELPDGTRKPKMKPTTDEKWKAAHGADEVDIANTAYPDLPDDWKAENKAAGEVVEGILNEHGGSVDLSDEATRLKVGEQIHAAWLSRNGYAKDGPLDVPFADLPADEQAKDLDQLAVAKKALAPVEKAAAAVPPAGGTFNKKTKTGIPIGPQDVTTSAGPGKLVGRSGKTVYEPAADEVLQVRRHRNGGKYGIYLVGPKLEDHIEQEMTERQARTRLTQLNAHLGRGPDGKPLTGAAPKAAAPAAKKAAAAAAPAAAKKVALIPHSDAVNHGDSALGELWESLPKATDEDRRLANTVESLASTMSLPSNHKDVEAPQKALDELKRIRSSAPASAHPSINDAITKLDAPPAKAVNLPDSTPPVLRGIMDDLQKIPAARKSGRVGGRTRDKSTVQELADLIKETSEGKGDPRTLDSRIHDILRGHHESVEGSQQMWAMETRLRDAFKEMRDWRRASFQAPSAPSAPKPSAAAASDLLDRIGGMKIVEIRAEAAKLGIDTEGKNKNALIHALEARLGKG